VKVVHSDSIIIAEQDSVITKQKVNIAYLDAENKSLLRQNKAIITTLKLFKSITIGLGILSVLMWLQ
jgi:hypothetical protein